ncbi:MAG TPA: SRPBCC family protein [Xanthobacteraceae bacterium]|nr:SRPBCC family protein [Xanthobacteraceae bacterium]
MPNTFILVVAVLAAALASFLAYVATRPGRFRIVRSAFIAAPPELVFARLEDFRNWRAWSPWEKKDPALTRTYRGPESGPGAVYEWSGNAAVGQGRMEITEVTPPMLLRIRLDFFKPFKASNVAEFTLTRRQGGTNLSWAMEGPSRFVSKLMGVLMNMDRIVGADFEAGLNNLKALAERAALEQAPPIDFQPGGGSDGSGA